MSNYTGVVISQVKEEPRVKENGSQYVLMTVQITEGPAKGKNVLATRTVLNKQGEVKSIPTIGADVIVYHTFLPSTREGELNQHFFEISLATATESNNSLDALFAA